MSDVPKGPDWWQASNQKWYPPEATPGRGLQPPPAPQKRGGGCLKGIGLATLIGFGVLVLLIVIVAVAIGGSDDSDKSKKDNNPATPGPTVPGVDPGLGSQDATADVTVTFCGAGDFGLVASGTITNSSSKSSNYAITVAFETADHATQLDTSLDYIQALAPGQSTTWEAPSLKTELKDTPDVTCRLVEVQRTAS